MSWLDADIPEEHTDPINPHYVGIELICVESGLEYKASVPFFAIRVSRSSQSDRFQIMFKGEVARYPGIGRALLLAGNDLKSVEKRIIQAINRPSLLRKAQIPDDVSCGATKSHNSHWPDRPNRDAPAEFLNCMEVCSGRIYRLVSRDYFVGVWRQSETDNFSITFWRYEDSKYNRKAVRFEAGDTMKSVEDHILQAISNPKVWLKFKKH